MRTQTEPHVEAIEFDEIEFKEMPTDIVVEAVREYEDSRSDLKTEDEFSADSTWGFLAHQVVGHELGQ
jgi:hypothetical protein